MIKMSGRFSEDARLRGAQAADSQRRWLRCSRSRECLISDRRTFAERSSRYSAMPAAAKHKGLDSWERSERPQARCSAAQPGAYRRFRDRDRSSLESTAHVPESEHTPPKQPKAQTFVAFSRFGAPMRYYLLVGIVAIIMATLLWV